MCHLIINFGFPCIVTSLRFVQTSRRCARRSEHGFACPVCGKNVEIIRSFIAHLKMWIECQIDNKKKLAACTNAVKSDEDAHEDTMKDKEIVASIPSLSLSLVAKISVPLA